MKIVHADMAKGLVEHWHNCPIEERVNEKIVAAAIRGESEISVGPLREEECYEADVILHELGYSTHIEIEDRLSKGSTWRLFIYWD